MNKPFNPCLHCKSRNDNCAACELQAYRALGSVEELTKAKVEGRLVVFPAVSEQDKQGMANFLHDCFVEWTDDPSVGLYGMTEGEAALSNAIMAALTRVEAEAALSGGNNDGR